MVFTLYIMFLPSVLCFVWFLMLMPKHDRTRRQLLLASFFLLLGVYFFTDVNWVMSKTTFNEAVISDLIQRTVMLLILPIVFLYIRTLDGNVNRRVWEYILFMPAIILFIVLVVCISLMGIAETAAVYDTTRFLGGFPQGDTDSLHRLYYYTQHHFGNVVIIVESFFILAAILVFYHYNADLKGFFTGKLTDGIVSSNIILALMFGMLVLSLSESLFGFRFFQNHPLMCILYGSLYSLLVGACGYLGSYFDYTPVRLNFFRLPLVPLSGPDAEHSMLAPYVAEDPGPRLGEVYIQTEFVNYFDKEKPYLNPDLSIEDVAASLHTNRTYISIFVNQFYNLTFREYVNKMRIEYAEALLLGDSGMRMDDVARRSGFLTSTQMGRKFKEIEGMTPTEWRVRSRNQ